MPAPRPSAADFRARVLRKEHVLGTFIKTPTSHSTEIVGSVGFDFVILDQEHAPFDRGSIDIACLAGRAANVATIVRVAEATPAGILSALDVGATGVMAPHVDGVEKARAVAAACRYRRGVRGFSNTTRAGDYGGRGLWAHVEAQDGAVVALGMIEDREALSQLDAILATPGLDGVFIGRGDLTVALGAAGLDAPETQGATEAILAAARRAGKPACIMVASAAEAGTWRRLGASAFIVSSDQGFLRAGAAKTASDFAALRGAP